MVWQAIFEWTVVVLLFGLGFYTMRVVKNEKVNFLKEAREINFQIFKLKVPKWWGEVETNDPKQICFKRLDTRYEWEAYFTWIEVPTDKNLINLFKEKVHEKKILFDEDTSVVYDPSDFLEGKFEMVRLEGTATRDREERLYYDAFIAREKSSGKYLFAESKSSVLNGLIEGPYFEEVMNRLELI